jgi:hypothetical protein
MERWKDGKRQIIPLGVRKEPNAGLFFEESWRDEAAKRYFTNSKKMTFDSFGSPSGTTWKVGHSLLAVGYPLIIGLQCFEAGMSGGS